MIAQSRRTGALFFIALLLLVHTERRLAEAQYDLLSPAETRIENDAVPDCDEIAVRLLALFDVSLPVIEVPDRPVLLPVLPVVESVLETTGSAPTSRSPPRPA